MVHTCVEVAAEDSHWLVTDHSRSGNIVSVELLNLQRLVRVQGHGQRVSLSIPDALEEHFQLRFRREGHVHCRVVIERGHAHLHELARVVPADDVVGAAEASDWKHEEAAARRSCAVVRRNTDRLR